MTRVKLLVLGPGGFGAEVASLIADTADLEVAGFVQNQSPDAEPRELLGKRVYWIDEIGDLAGTHQALGAMGTTRRRAFIEAVGQLGFGFATLVHPTATLLGRPELGEGTVINVAAVLASHTSIGDHVLINRGSLIGHHTRIEPFCTIGPGVNIAASVIVGAGSYIGMGAVVRDHVTIGTGSVVGAGAVVLRDVPDHVQVTGFPAKITKEGVDGL